MAAPKEKKYVKESTLILPGTDQKIKLADPILQRHVENFFREKRVLDGPSESVMSAFELNGNFLRAACIAKIILEGLKPEDVLEMNPGNVQWLAIKIDLYMATFSEVPKN